MGLARPCFGDSSRGFRALNECRDVGSGFPAAGGKVMSGMEASPLDP